MPICPGGPRQPQLRPTPSTRSVISLSIFGLPPNHHPTRLPNVSRLAEQGFPLAHHSARPSRSKRTSAPPLPAPSTPRRAGALPSSSRLAGASLSPPFNVARSTGFFSAARPQAAHQPRSEKCIHRSSLWVACSDLGATIGTTGALAHHPIYVFLIHPR